MYRGMDCDNSHFEDCLSPEILLVTLARFLSWLSTNISTSIPQNLRPSFNVIAVRLLLTSLPTCAL